MTSKDEDVKLEEEIDILDNKQPSGHSLWWVYDAAAYMNWLKDVNEKSRLKTLDKMTKSVLELRIFVNTDGILRQYLVNMIQEANLIYGELFNKCLLPRNVNEFWAMTDTVVNRAPAFHGLNVGGDPSLIGVPLAALWTLFDGTPSGVKLFGDNTFNRKLQELLVDWGKFLSSEQSKYVLNDGKNGWLSKKAKEAYKFPEYVLPSSEPPYWNSWNDFFHREIKLKLRPIGEGITSCNDGFVWVYPYRDNIKKESKYWLKDNMPYSLTQIFGYDLRKYVDRFIGGGIFQTFLGPYNYHRWHSPVSGKIVKVSIIKGCYYKKLIVPDISGSTTSSLPYILHVNTRGILIIDTTDTLGIGLVTCIPIGMVEVSSIIFNVKEGDTVKKGDELGYFAFGGSSFAIIFEDLKKYNKKLKIVSPFNKKASLPTPTGGGQAIRAREKFAEIENCKKL